MAIRKVLSSFLGLILSVLLLVLHFVIMMCYINRWDSVTTLTLLPIWMWAGAGLLLCGLIWLFFRGRLAVLGMLVWLLTGLAAADETPGLLRQLRTAVLGQDAAKLLAIPDEEKLRVVSLLAPTEENYSLEQISGLNPDIVMIQNAPGRDVLRPLAAKFFGDEGSYVHSWNCAILARGHLERVAIDESTASLYATLELPTGQVLDLVNISLEPILDPESFWKPEAWESNESLRVSNRNHVRSVIRMLPQHLVTPPTIVGGDLGVPPSDDIYRVLRSHFVDVYRDAGEGCGNTLPTKLPLFRTNYVWANDQLIPLKATVQPSQNSTYRAVVCDLRLMGPQGTLAMAGRTIFL